jgi:hypothetical protein
LRQGRGCHGTLMDSCSAIGMPGSLGEHRGRVLEGSGWSGVHWEPDRAGWPVQQESTATGADLTGQAHTSWDGDLHRRTSVDVLPVDGMQEVRGSNPRSSTFFRICVRPKVTIFSHLEPARYVHSCGDFKGCPHAFRARGRCSPTSAVGGSSRAVSAARARELSLVVIAHGVAPTGALGVSARCRGSGKPRLVYPGARLARDAASTPVRTSW